METTLGHLRNYFSTWYDDEELGDNEEVTVHKDGVVTHEGETLFRLEPDKEFSSFIELLKSRED